MTMLLQADFGHTLHLSSFSDTNSTVLHRGISSLPPEILSYIFILGSDDLGYEDFRDFGPDSDSDDVEYDDGDDDGGVPTHIAIPCSWVCQYWRNVAISTGQLWSNLRFDGSSTSLERAKVWIPRSKDVPLAIQVDLATDEPTKRGSMPGTLSEDITLPISGEEYRERSYRILDLILPHVLRWKMFVLETNSYDLIWIWHESLTQVPSAPILEHIGIFCYTEWMTEGDPAVFRAPHILFPLGSPTIRSVVLWGVHFDWELVTFITGLASLHLAWHTKDVRPTVEQFLQMLYRSPKLETLNLEGSAPLPGSWPLERILLPNLRRLGLAQIDVADALFVVNHIDFPALVALKLDLELENVKLLIRAFCPSNKPRLGSLETLRIASFHCSRDDGKLLLSTLLNVKSMILDFHFLPTHFCDSLTSHSPLLCPKLEMLKLSGLKARQLKALIKARKRSPTPIQRLYLDADDEFSPSTVEWLRNEVKTVMFFENSDVEDDDEEEEEEEDWTDASHDTESEMGKAD